MRSKKVFFNNGTGERIAALLDMPVDNRPSHYAIIAHCFTCTKNIKAIHYISRALTQRHIAVLRFDFTGLGESEGDFAESNFSSNVEDLLCAARYLEDEHQAVGILIGHSLGGTAALAAASQIPSVKGVVTIGSPFEPHHVLHHFKKEQAEIEANGEAEVVVGGQRYRMKQQFLDDVRGVKMRQPIKQLGCALLVLHASNDDTVAMDNAGKIFEAARHPKSFVSLDDAGHLLSDKKDARYAGGLIASWAEKYLAIEPSSNSASLSDDAVVSASIGRERYYTEIDAHGYGLVADEPESMGGGALGPTPYELLAAALGACTAMTLRMYADHKKWPLAEVDVKIRHRKIHAKDCAECEDKTGKVDLFEREIELVGKLSDEQRQRLLAIADRCPVHKTLHAEVRVTSRLI
ncbi:MAG: OsmC family protein [Thiotrichaceae bacterium]|nr:OsmC family protein [Thiotrichaceae bacterium]PCI12179.1 MAG: osmotically inducible protein C [Thiotrichales bacterium]